MANQSTKEKLEEDLRTHYDSLTAGGMNPTEALERMGTPDEICREFMQEIPRQFSGIIERFTAFLVDMAVIFLVLLPAIFLSMVLWQQSYTFLTELDPGMEGFLLGDPLRVFLHVGKAGVAGMLFLSIMAVVLLYWPFFERLTAVTPGKRLLGMK
ncbi:hypothetical protein GF324_11660, partial [bacterium]|nr:hypothetical protein [bacterium]